MKTTERQNKFIDEMVLSLKRLKETNDIGSPTHWNDLALDVDQAVENLTNSHDEEHPQAELINKHALDGLEWLLVAIRKIEIDPTR